MIEGLKTSDAQKSSKVDRLLRKLQESNKKARHLSKQVTQVLQDKDHDAVEVEVESQATRHARDKLAEEELAQVRLQKEGAHREVLEL
ncbi:uncharacterized protein A4U43_C05F18110 [Asparagus officinalis]|uniref:Uncharacterized protein n=1 Tax=Asparagus officinalis TaxID=4686 RepID=A0A5P1ESG5_ASPOF|nr:uncharacterized protein A4U43_C05F18110 [Asparagus officinalis]